MESPETRYVTVGDAQIAYQVEGAGPDDVVFCMGLSAQAEFAWQVPLLAELLAALRAVRRVINFDRRGVGASDPVPLNAIPTWEELAEDITAVRDAVGSTRAALVAGQETGPIALLFAAMHPERVSHLILITTTARYMEADDYPIGVSSRTIDTIVDLIAEGWGTEDFTRMLMPSHAHDSEVVRSWARMARASATPKTSAALFSDFMRNLDVRSFLPLVQAPTLILHATESQFIPIAQARYLAEHLADTTVIEWAGTGLVPPDYDRLISDGVEFLTGERPIDVNRVLTTVLFTDIVGSTQHAAALGHQRWHTLLDAHDRTVREHARRFKGKEIKTTGDGFILSFDGPARAIRCAQAINEAVAPLGIQLRIGLHTGECVVRGDDLGGLAVHIAARVGALASSQEIVVSGTVKDLVMGSGIEFDDRGEHELKGVPGTWRLFGVRD